METIWHGHIANPKRVTKRRTKTIRGIVSSVLDDSKMEVEGGVITFIGSLLCT